MNYLKTTLEILTVIFLYFAIVGALHEILTLYMKWWTTFLYLAVISAMSYYLLIMVGNQLRK